ncbi:MAG: hypothetical protein RMA76_38075 [Deltaproteobacteria bacterium]
MQMKSPRTVDLESTEDLPLDLRPIGLSPIRQAIEAGAAAYHEADPFSSRAFKGAAVYDTVLATLRRNVRTLRIGEDYYDGEVEAVAIDDGSVVLVPMLSEIGADGAPCPKRQLGRAKARLLRGVQQLHLSGMSPPDGAPVHPNPTVYVLAFCRLKTPRCDPETGVLRRTAMRFWICDWSTDEDGSFMKRGRSLEGHMVELVTYGDVDGDDDGSGPDPEPDVPVKLR